MILQLRVAHWAYQCVVQMDTDGLALLGDYGLSSGVEVELIDGDLVFVAKEGGHSPVLSREYNAPGWDYSFEFKEDGGHLLDLGYFRLHTVDGRLEQGMLVIPLALPYELPWPSSTFRLTDEQWEREIALRIASAKAAGLKTLQAPSWAKKGRKHHWRAALKLPTNSKEDQYVQPVS